MKRSLLIALYTLLISGPMLLSWYLVGKPRDPMQELGSVLGILAFSMILSEFMLSGRVKSFSRKVGMDSTMKLHRVVGWLILIFALIHPFLYESTPTAGPRPWDDTRQLSVSTDFSAIATGVIAFLLIPVLVVLAVWRSSLDYRYETWRRLHGLIAAIVVLLLLDHTLAAGRYAAQPYVALLWQVLSVIALLSLAYRYLWVPLTQSRRPWRVSQIERVAERQWHLELTPEGHNGIDYTAGQFAWIKVGRSAISIGENPFSIASAPASGRNLSFVIKELGDFTETLSTLEPGTRAYVDGPYGSLLVDGREEPDIGLIAGGVGIAPMLGILRQLHLTNDPRTIQVIYANRTEEQIVYREELDSANALYVLSEPPIGWQGATGVVDAALISQTFSQAQFDSWVFVLCGPVPMMDTVREALRQQGVTEARILMERFNYD